jgi:hypothetical protein
MLVSRFVGDLAVARIPDLRLTETLAAGGTVASASVVQEGTGESRWYDLIEMGTSRKPIGRLRGTELSGWR